MQIVHSSFHPCATCYDRRWRVAAGETTPSECPKCKGNGGAYVAWGFGGDDDAEDEPAQDFAESPHPATDAGQRRA